MFSHDKQMNDEQAHFQKFQKIFLRFVNLRKYAELRRNIYIHKHQNIYIFLIYMVLFI